MFVRSPWGQGIIVDKATSYLQDKTGAEVKIGKLFITFSGNLSLEEFYISDNLGDTLVYSDELEAGLELIPFIQNGAIHVSQFQWNGLTARIKRPESTGKFNYEFLIDAFSSSDSTAVQDSVSTEGSALNITLSPITLQNMDISYQDEVMGTDVKFKLGDFELAIPTLDLENYVFRIKEIFLAETNLSYKQTKPFPPSEETEEESILPKISIENLSLKDIILNYENTVDQQVAQLKIGDFILQIPEIDLPNQKVEIDQVSLANSEILFHDFSVSTAHPASDSSPEISEFTWPEWLVNVKSLSLQDNVLEYKTKDKAPVSGFFNPEVLHFENLNIEAKDLNLQENSLALNLEKAQFSEASGFELKDLIIALTADENKLTVENFFIETNRSFLSSNAKLSYSSIQNLLDNPDKSELQLAIKEVRLDLKDSYIFDPSLAQDTLIQELAKNPFTGEIEANGNLENIEIPILDFQWGETSLQTYGSVSNASNLDLMEVDFPEIGLKTNRKTLLAFINEADYGIQFPETIAIQAQAKGSLQDMLAKLELDSDLGDIMLDASYQDANQLSFDLDLQVNQLQLGTLLKNPDLDTLSLEIKAKGQGTSIYDLTANLESDFKRLKLYGSDYSGLKLAGDMENGNGNLSLNLKDEFLDFDLNSELVLDSVNSVIDLNLDLKGADFYRLGFTEKQSRARLQLEAKFTGNPDNFDISTTLHDGLILYGDKTYPTGNLDLQAKIQEDSTSINIASKLLNGFLQTNTNPQALAEALQNHFLAYFGQADSTLVPLDSNIVMNMELRISEDPLLNEVLFQGLEQLDSGSVQLAYYQNLDSVTASIDLPYINYAGTELDSIKLDLISNRDTMNLVFGFQQLTSSPLNMDRTTLTGKLSDSRVYFDFTSLVEEEKLAHIASDIGFSGDSMSIHINPENLILNKAEWSVPETNEVIYATNYLGFQDFSFTRNSQELTFERNIPGFTEENIAVVFNNFRLGTFTSLLNPDELIAGGKMNGQLVVENPFTAIGLMGKLEIDSLKAIGVPLGNLDLEATAKSLGNYILDLKLRDGGIDLDLNGGFVASESGGDLDIKLDLIKAQMEKIGELSQDQITDASGFISGTLNVSGSTTEPKYQGEFKFNEASFVPTEINTKYLLSNETIRADNEGIYFDQFTIRDTDNNTFDINGKVLTEDLTNPSFDLNLTAKNFMVVNSTDEESDLLYGKGTIDADVSIKGDLVLPIVQANLTIKDNTDLTLIIPETELDLVERDGVVLFVNKQNPDDILTAQLEETTTAFSGYDIQAILSADLNAKFTIVIDPKTGDNLLVSGSANLQMDINPNGRITLSGAYEITDGHYEMSLYNLISKKFDISPGSRITWNGDPMDANLEIRAIYEVETAASDLMSSQLTGSNQETQSQYKRKIPFLVYLNVSGELLKPEISFTLDMPENQRGSFGGSVYSQVLQINEQEDELNKQVFSLLVLNRFFPSQGSDGSNGGAAAIARNSASQVLSDQMNALSSRIFGDSGFQLGVDLDTYREYESGTGQNRTDLNINAQQTLFDDRLVVQVGSQVDLEGSSQSSSTQSGNSILANISFEYMLTEDGRWRIRAFRKNQFESVIDGQLVITGAGLIFNREFNEFSELWKAPKSIESTSEEVKKENEKKEENEK